MSNALQKQEGGQVVSINDNSALMTAIARAASDPTVDVEKMERLFAMHERMEAKQSEAAFNTALSRVQARMGRIGTDKRNNQTHSEYATYGKLDRVLRPLYTEAGFALSFGTEPCGDSMVRVICDVSHQAGHVRRYAIDMPSDGKGAKGNDVMTKTHATGSATQYGMRYLLKMIFNVAIGDEDDDGNAADKGGVEPITEEQAANIQDMLDATKADVPKFLAWLGVDRVDEIPANRFDSAMKVLRQKEQSK